MKAPAWVLDQAGVDFLKPAAAEWVGISVTRLAPWLAGYRSAPRHQNLRHVHSTDHPPRE